MNVHGIASRLPEFLLKLKHKTHYRNTKGRRLCKTKNLDKFDILIFGRHKYGRLKEAGRKGKPCFDLHLKKKTEGPGSSTSRLHVLHPTTPATPRPSPNLGPLIVKSGKFTDVENSLKEPSMSNVFFSRRLLPKIYNGKPTNKVL